MLAHEAFYLFLGLLRRNNSAAFHIDSIAFDESDFEMLGWSQIQN
jgi:phage replication-related protein YjqB (UPF0714/DUF867 family)